MKKLNELQSYLTRLRGLMLTLIILCSIGIGNVWGQASTHTSNVTLNNGSNCSNCSIVISGNTFSGKKLGTSSKTGSTSFTVPAGVTTVYVHAARWNGDGGNINVTRSSGTVSPTSLSLTADAGVSGNGSTFTLSTPGNATTSYFFTLTLQSKNTETTITLTTSNKRAVVWGVNTASATKTFNLKVPDGTGGYTTRSSQESSAMTEATATGGHSCGSGLAGYYASIWVTSAISTPTSTYPSPVYTSSNIDASSVASGSNLYPVFTNDAGKYLTNPSCAAVKTLSSIAITTQPTTTKYLVGETFSSAGAVVTATYSDATTATVSANWTPTTGLVAGSNTITASYTEGGVTKTATTTVTAYSVTVQKKDEDGTTIADAGVTASASGRSLTASVGSTHYVFKTWKYGTASGTSIASATSASTSLTGTPSAAVTVIAEFYKPCTVTWSVNGSTYSTTANVSYNTTTSTPANPSVPPTCTGSTFMGWTATQNYTGDSAPGNMFNGTSPTITGDITFYAVFADED